ncbi:MAG: PTS sugar transporter subunit IIA [Gemmatimonadales bacterium]
MSDPLRGVVVAHGDVARALVGAAEEISGLRGALSAVSNSGLGRAELEQRVMEAVDGHPAIVFVDLPSGSCLFAAMRRVAALPVVRVVTGVNLVMLLEFLFHRGEPIDEVVRRTAESGAKGIGAR